MKKPSRLKSRRKADCLWSQLIMKKGKCEVCGETKYLNPHHIVGRRNLTLRYDLDNGICLCSGCHTLKRNSAHQNPVWFLNWLQEERGTLAYLARKGQELTTQIDYEERIKELKELLNKKQ